jgi:hypothetical protein
VAAAKVVYYALNKISFFVNSLKAVDALAKARVRVSIYKDGFIKLRLGLS